MEAHEFGKGIQDSGRYPSAPDFGGQASLWCLEIDADMIKIRTDDQEDQEIGLCAADA